jgi:DNA-binding beta-propeller fold protein YncE
MTVLIDYTKGFFETIEGEGVGTVTAGTGPYNLDVASYDGVSFSVATEVNSPYSILFGDNGYKLYVLDLNNDDITQYDLTSAYVLSTASLTQTLSVSTQEAAPTGMEFKPDGTKLYVVGYGGDEVNEYSLSTAWDISTASFVQNFSILSQTNTPREIVFHPDGDKFWVIEITSDSVLQYNLSTAWDISTASYASVSFVFTSQDSNPVNIFFALDGTRMFMMGDVTNTVYQYSLSTAYDVSTASYDSVSFSVGSQDTGMVSMTFNADGTKMYTAGLVSDTVYQYSTGTATTIDLSTGSVFSHTPTANTTFAFSNPPASGTASSATLKLTGANVVTGYDLANASYDSVSFSVAGQEGNPEALFFKPDGTKMYITGTTGDDVNEYNLSTAWDISTASYLQNFSVSAQEATPTGLFFKPDGTKMYISGSTGDDINEYDLSTAWDVSTASYSQNFSVDTEDTIPTDLFFKPDGTKMYVLGTAGDNVNEYNLSTAWDISTASYSQNFSFATQDAGTEGLFFKPDGKKMFMVGRVGDNVYEYDLSTAWDVSTGSYLRSFSVSGQETNPRGLSFKSDGSKMYIIGLGTDTIYQYSTGSSALATITYPSSVIWSGGTAPTAPANGETDVYTFYTDDGGTTYYGFQVGDALA